MTATILKKFGFFLIGFFFSMHIYSQNMAKMLVEKQDDPSIIIPPRCFPNDLIILINSSIENLKFESNILPDQEFEVIHDKQSNQYIICHEKIKFQLMVSGPNLESEEIEIFDLNDKHVYKISANTEKGTVNIITNPRNTQIMFTELNQTLSSNNPITQITGKYLVKITKPFYEPIDTVITIYSNSEKTYEFDLIPLFPQLKLDIRTDDNLPFTSPPVLWIDSTRLELEALVKSGTNQFSFRDGVEFYKFYENNIVPIPEGYHNIRIEAESYIPYETTINAINSRLHEISISLQPVFGYLTFIDKQFSEGAEIFLDGKNIGQVPIFKMKTRVGKHIIKIDKTGFMSTKEEYIANVIEGKTTDMELSMLVAKKIIFETEPYNAEVILDNTRIGFSPCGTTVHAGNHEIFIKKNGFAPEKKFITINEKSPDEDTILFNLRMNSQLLIVSEKQDVPFTLNGKDELKNVEIPNPFTAPGNVLLPYGKYKVTFTDDGKIAYKGSLTHSPEIEKRGKIPYYSKSSFSILSGYYENNNSFEASFGRVHLFRGSGLSTAILNADYKLLSFQTDSANYEFKTLAPYLFFLNWDWRIGGSILRQLDICFLGRAKYTPGIKQLKVNIPGLTDVEMQNYFYGIEISTRLSYFNVCFRYGKQINYGKINLWDDTNEKYVESDFPIDLKRNVASIGFSLNQKVYKSNKMLRLWYKPFYDLSQRKTKTENKKQENIFKKTFNSLFGKTKNTKSQ